MATTIAPNVRPESYDSEQRPKLGPELPDEAHRAIDGRSLDPTQGRKIGADPYDDPTQGRRIGSDPYDDPTRGR
jgi:hypothetical protein